MCGDIDVVKSKWCIIKWTYSKGCGKPVIEKASDFPGEVGLPRVVEGQENTLTKQKGC